MFKEIDNLFFESDKILSSLSPEEHTLLNSYTRPLNFKEGQLIFYENGVPTGVFIIKKGKVKIFKTGIYGKEQIFYIYKEGDLFGYHALLANEKYEDASQTIEDCEILFINKDDFQTLLEKIPSLKHLLIQNMSHEFGVLVNTITILAQKTLRARLALYLLKLYDTYHDKTTNTSIINLPREDLANIIGTARESLGRLLKQFKEEKLISVNKREIELIDIQKLRAIANS